jgi:hypothetical protein
VTSSRDAPGYASRRAGDRQVPTTAGEDRMARRRGVKARYADGPGHYQNRIDKARKARQGSGGPRSHARSCSLVDALRAPEPPNVSQVSRPGSARRLWAARALFGLGLLQFLR